MKDIRTSLRRRRPSWTTPGQAARTPSRSQAHPAAARHARKSRLRERGTSSPSVGIHLLRARLSGRLLATSRPKTKSATPPEAGRQNPSNGPAINDLAVSRENGPSQCGPKSRIQVRSGYAPPRQRAARRCARPADVPGRQRTAGRSRRTGRRTHRALGTGRLSSASPGRNPSRG